MKQTLGVLAHVDAGKTTFCEQLLYNTHVIRSCGRVDTQSAFLDYNAVERARGITVFSDTARLFVGENTLTLIDTPGHADFSAETERAVAAMDYALLLVSAIEGVQSHTETVWRLLRAYNVPTFIFINKTDAATARTDAVMAELAERLSPDILDFSEGHPWEALAERSEPLLNAYADGVLGEAQLAYVRDMIADCAVFPCYRGSALHDEGVSEFLDEFFALAREKSYPESPFSAVCCKVRRDGKQRVAFLKLTGGMLRVKDEVQTPGGLQKAHELRFYDGEKFTQAQVASAGELVGVTGLSSVRVGDVLGGGAARGFSELSPLFSSRVLHDAAHAPRTVLDYFRILEDEDPLLGVSWNEAAQEIHIRVMGKIQLEVLAYQLRTRFDTEVSFGKCSVLYRETVSSPVLGYGHYEPLRHYAEVHIEISPLPRGSGLRFSSKCPTDVLERSFQNLVRTHVFEKEHKGVLTGSPLTDVEFSLINGRAHEKHTEGGDFREATYRAIRQALEHAESVLLEPMYAFSARTDSARIGKLMSDIRGMGGVFEPPMLTGDRAELCGRAAASDLSDYAAESAAAGVAISLRFDGYAPCREPDRVIAELGYDRARDIENPSDSVFCSHGVGVSVKWYDVPNHIHCK